MKEDLIKQQTFLEGVKTTVDGIKSSVTNDFVGVKHSISNIIEMLKVQDLT